MPRLNGRANIHRGGFTPLAPVVAGGALLGALVMIVLAVVTLGLALLLPGARRRVRVFRGVRYAASAGADRPAPRKMRRRPTPSPAPTPRCSSCGRCCSPPRCCVPAVAHAKLLVPMDDAQANHLKAYGLTFWVLERSVTSASGS